MRRPNATLRASLLVPAAIAALVVVALPAAALAQKRPLAYTDYDTWRSIDQPQLSHDGQWLVYVHAMQDGDGEIVARHLDRGTEYRHPRGRDPKFSADGRFVVFAIQPLKADRDKAKREKKKPEDQPKNGLGAMDLQTGQVWTSERVKSFKLPEKGGAVVAYLREAEKDESGAAKEKKSEPEEGAAKEKKAEPEEKDEKKPKEKKKDPGTTLVVRDLASGQETSIANVTEYTWNEPGTWLAYTTSSKTPDEDGAFARRTAGGAVVALATGEGHYKGIVFDKAGEQAAFVSNRGTYRDDVPRFSLYHWRADATAAGASASTGMSASSATSAARVLAGPSTPGLPDGHGVSEHGSLEFSKDGRRLFLGTAPLPPPDPGEDAPDPIKVDLWHWKDPELQTVQKVRADQEKKRAYRAVVTVADGRFVQLATPDIPEIDLTDEGTAGIARSSVPYLPLVSWDASYSDIYALDLATGEKRRVVEKARYGATLSPDGRAIVTYDVGARAWFGVDLATGARTDLTSALPVSFEDEAWDLPDSPRPYGVAGWLDDGRSVLLYDRYDIWQVPLDGRDARMLTDGHGRREHLVYRYVKLDPEATSIAAREPMVLSVRNERTKASGFARHAGPAAGPAAPTTLYTAERMVSQLAKAKDADRVIFRRQRFDEYPDVWTSTLAFAAPTQVTHANPQQEGIRWGRASLTSYVNADGRTLDALLIVPEDFDPSQQYPLMVYIYEELSDSLHQYRAPAPGTSINIPRYVSNGYVVLMPDISYDTGYPGESALKCVVPAVLQLVDEGFIDRQRIGIQGHSWGGYQISYLITRTDLFRAVQAGASVVNMTSAYGGIRWGTGLSRAFQYEKTQSRIGGPPWDYPLQFIENSPLFWVEKVTTPYMTIHNDEDDAVPWYQGIEFFSALRRLGKEAYLFNYNGEKHGLRERDNQKHWTVHMDEFFDHHLKGAPKPAWMEQGVRYLDRGRRDVGALFKATPEATSDARSH